MAQAGLALCPLPRALAPQGLAREGDHPKNSNLSFFQNFIFVPSASARVYKGLLQSPHTRFHLLTPPPPFCAQATSTLARYLSGPPPSSSPTHNADSLLAHESLTYALSPEPGTAAVPTPSEGGAGGQPRYVLKSLEHST